MAQAMTEGGNLPACRRLSNERFYKNQPYTPSVTFNATSPYTPGGKRPAGGGFRTRPNLLFPDR